MSGRKQYEYQKIDRATERQDDWYLQRRRDISREENAVQTKMEISQPGDVHEQEADMIAQNVMSGGNANVDQLTPTGKNVQTKSESGAMYASSEFQEKLESVKGSGQYMDDVVRSEMESKMGVDLSGVKIHTGGEAHDLSNSIGAKAFTIGQDLFFKEGNYDTTSLPGIELLAHELAHTVQQKKGIHRKIQRVVSDADIKTIADYLAPHLFEAREVKRNAVLNILSNEENTQQDIIDAWGDPKLKRHLEYFVDSFDRVEDFDEYPLQIAATFRALDVDTRVNKIQSLVKRGITSNEAVRVLYLMQGLTDYHLNLAFSLDPPDSSPTKYDLFKMALPPGETERLAAAYVSSSNLLVNLRVALEEAKAEGDIVKVEKIEKQIKDLEENDAERKRRIKLTAYKVNVALGIESTILDEPGKEAGMEQAKEDKKAKKKIDNQVVEPYQAITAYRFIKELYVFSPVAEEQFGYQYPELYAKVMENLPVQFMHSPEFGMQTVHHDEADTKEDAAAYHFLYKFSKPYRFLYNYADAFGNIMLLKGKIKLGSKEADKPYLFDERRTKVETAVESDESSLVSNIENLKSVISDDFVPIDEKDAFNAGLDAIFNEVIVPEDPMAGPMLTDPNWIYLPGTSDINYPYMLTLLSGLMDRQLQRGILANKEAQKGDYKPENDPINLAKKYLDERPDLFTTLIASPLPVMGDDTPELAEQLETDANLLDVYNEDTGIFQLLNDSTLWDVTPDAYTRLASALSLVVAAGLGEKVAAFVNTTDKKKPENEQILKDHGFNNGTYVPITASMGGTSAKLDIPVMLENLVTDQLISLHPRKKNKIKRWPPWRKYAFMLLRHPFKSWDLIKAGVYFLEGLYLSNRPFLNKRVGKEVHYRDLDLVSVQEGMGGQIYGMEFGNDLDEKNKALLDIDVDELNGIAVVDSSILNIKAMNMQYPDMLFTSGEGEFLGVHAEIKWPTDRTTDEGSTLMTFTSLVLNDLRYQDNETLFSLGKIEIKGLTITSNKPIANYTQMNNWYNLFFSVMQFIQDILALLMNGIQVSAQRYAPNMIEDITHPEKDSGNPEKAMSEFLLQRLSEGQMITIGYDALKIEDMLINDMGIIKSFETGGATMTSSNYAIGDEGEHEMYFGFSGSNLEINGADISGFKSKTMGAGVFGMGLYFSEPSDGVDTGRDMATLRSLSQLSVQNDPTEGSRLKRMDFTLDAMFGEGLNIVGLDMKTLPFTGVSGSVEFIDAIPKNGNTAAIPPKVHIKLHYVTDVNFGELPYPADMSFRIISNPDSNLRGDIRNADIMLTLNSEEDQIKNGWDIQTVEIISMTIPVLTGNNFSIITQGTETTIKEGGTIAPIILSGFVMEHHKDELDPWDIKTLSLATGGVDMQGIGIKTAAGISTTLNEFKAGSMSFGMVVTDSVVDGKQKEVTKYTYGAKGVTTSGHVDYTSPVDPYDASKKPISIGADLTMTNNDIGGSYTQTKIDGVTDESDMTMTSTIQLLSIPSLNVTSDKLKIVAPEVTGQSLILDTVSADVSVHFNKFGDATDFTILSLNVVKISTYGLLITDLVKNKNLVDVADNVASYIEGFFIMNMVMEKRPFTEYEIAEMKRNKKETPMPDYDQTWDFNQTEGEKGVNKVGFTSSSMPLGMKMAIGDSIGVQMTKATSKDAWFQFVRIGANTEFSYSIMELDAKGIKITDDGKTIFKGDLDSEEESGTYKQEIIGKGDDAKKKITLTGTLKIPSILIHQLNISSDNALIEIPEDATQTSSIMNVNGTYQVVITEPSENEKKAARAEAAEAQALLDADAKLSVSKLSEQRKKEITEIAKKEAKSDIEITIIDMTIEKIQGYGLHIKTTSETDIEKSITPGGKEIETYDTQAYELKLRNDMAATLNNIVMKDFKIVLPADEEKKMVISTGMDNIDTPDVDESGFQIGGKKDKAGNIIPGIDIGTTEIISNSFKSLLEGTQKGTPPSVNNTYATTSMKVTKLTFGGTTEGEYTVTIDDPQFWFPKNRTGNDDNVLSNTLTHSLDETYPWNGAPKIEQNTNTSVLLNKLQNRETPVLSADNVIIKRTKLPDKGPNGEDLFVTKVMVTDPVLEPIDITTKMEEATKPGQLLEQTITVGGKIKGILEIRFEKANFAENANAQLSPDMQDAIVIAPTEGSTITLSEETQMVMKFVPDPNREGFHAMTHDEWVAERQAEQELNNDNTEAGVTDTDAELVDRYNDIDEHGSEEEVKKRHGFDFLDGAVSGSITLTLFGEPTVINIVDGIDGNGESHHGYVNIATAIDSIRTTLLAGNRITNIAVRDVIAGLDVDEDDVEGYNLEAYLANNVMMLVPRQDDNILEDANGNIVIRLAEMLNFLSNQPRHVTSTDPDTFILGGLTTVLTEATAEQVLVDWMNGDAFVPQISLTDVKIDFSQIDKNHRGLMSFINSDDSSVTISMQAGLNSSRYRRTPAEIAAGITQTTTQGPTGHLTSKLVLPDIRVPMKNSEKAIDAVFSATKIEIENFSFEYQNFKMEKLTLIPSGIDIQGFKYDIKNTSEKKK